MEKEQKEVKKTSLKTKALSLFAILMGFVGLGSAADVIIFGFNASSVINALPNLTTLITDLITFASGIIWALLGLIVGAVLLVVVVKFIMLPVNIINVILKVIERMFGGMKF